MGVEVAGDGDVTVCEDFGCATYSLVCDASVAAKAVTGPPTHALYEPLGTSHGCGCGGSANAEGMSGDVGEIICS